MASPEHSSFQEPDATLACIEAVIRTMHGGPVEAGNISQGLGDAAETTAANLGEAFARDPFVVLKDQSRKMFDVFHDPNLNDEQRQEQLNAYFDLIESLDRAAFPPTEGVQAGAPPDYLPHGFIDMGGVDSPVPHERDGQPMNYVDTAALLRRHRAVFEDVFTNMHPDEFSGMERHTHYAFEVIASVAQQIHRSLPHGEPEPAERGGMLPLSTVDVATSRQSALTAQVLLQAFGMRVRLSNSYTDGEASRTSFRPLPPSVPHTGNVVTVTGLGGARDYMMDTHHPLQERNGEQRPGIFYTNSQESSDRWTAIGGGGAQQRTYRERSDEMFWAVER